jgi:hypothetical protein
VEVFQLVKHESSVNFENLIKDLADMYPFDVGEVVLVELVANALDSKANQIKIDYDKHAKSLVVTDNGTGMSQNDFNQYHDFAAGLKTKGMGIGFAGVGAKISFNIASQVITETKSASYYGGSNWYLEAGNKLVWNDITPTNLDTYGTRVKVVFRKDVGLPFENDESLIFLLRQHYLPLLDNNFLNLYNDLKFYTNTLRFVINGKSLEPAGIVTDYQLTKTHEFFPTNLNKKIGYGLFGLSSVEYPLGENLCGIMLCTHGKVVKADLFNQFPGDIGPKIMGVVEIPGLIHFLTSSKTDFFKRKKLKEFEKLYDPIRQEFKKWLKELGVQSTDLALNDEVLKLEREMKKLIDDIPELGEFFGFRTAKQVLQSQAEGNILAEYQEGAEITFPLNGEGSQANETILDIGDEHGEALVEDLENGNTRAKPISRKSKRGPKIAFSESPERIDISWVDGNNIVINSGHSAYKKVLSNSTANRVHCMFAIANAIQKFLFTGQQEDLMFLEKMMSAWGNK